MKLISTGQPSNLKTYRGIAFALDGFKEGKAVEFIDKKINQYPDGEKEEVIADEEQMIKLLNQIANEDKEPVMKFSECGKCDICKKEGVLNRKYYYYDIKCSCHSPRHFEIVMHCENCIPKPPVETKVWLSQDQLKPIEE